MYNLLTVLVTLLFGVIAYMKWKLRYWDKLGVPTLNPKLPFGNMTEIILGQKSFGEQFLDIYKSFKAKRCLHGGVYMGLSPVYVPLDPKTIKHIMQVDFPHFHSHGGYVDEEDDPLGAHLFNLDDVKWKNLRVKLTPTFTSGKMKMMFQTLADVSHDLKAVLNQSAESKTPVDIRDISSRFGTDIISSVAFGLECNSLKNPDIPFRTFGKKAVDFDFWDNIKIFMQVLLPYGLLKAMRYKLTKTDVEQFFMKVIRDTVDYREKNSIYRKDFMHLLLQLKNRGTVSDDGRITDESGETKEVALTINQLAAQAHVFFTAGYETSSTTVTFALYELSLNPDVQEKLRHEVKTVLAKHNDKMTYEAMMEMTYLEKAIHETLRKYPPLPILSRVCTKDYVLPNTNITIKKGSTVLIPVLGLQMDPEHYPNPEVFDPDRFSEEKKKERPAFTWLPFGDGPRVCIGMRMGMLQTKVALATVMKNYRVTLNKRTKFPMEFDKRSFVLRVDGGVWLDLVKIDSVDL